MKRVTPSLSLWVPTLVVCAILCYYFILATPNSQDDVVDENERAWLESLKIVSTARAAAKEASQQHERLKQANHHIIVTGGASTLGKRVVDALLALDYTVTSIDKAHKFKSQRDRLRVLPIDLQDQGRLNRHVFLPNLPITGIVHLSAISGCTSIEDCLRMSQEDTQVFISEVTKHSQATASFAPWIVYVSSWHVYSALSSTTQSNEAATVLTEDSPLGGNSLLGQVKQNGEDCVRASGLAALILRFSDLYGYSDLSTDAQRPETLTWLLRQALTHQPIPLYKSQLFVPNLLHFSDAKNSILAAVAFLQTEPKLQPGVVMNANIGSKDLISYDALVHFVLNITGSVAPIQYVSEIPMHVSASKWLAIPYQPSLVVASQKLGFLPKISWQEGLSTYLNHLRLRGQKYLQKLFSLSCNPLTESQILSWTDSISNCTGLLVQGDPVNEKLVTTMAIFEERMYFDRPRPDRSVSVRLSKQTDGFLLEVVNYNKFVTAHYDGANTWVTIEPTISEDALFKLHVHPVSRRLAFTTAYLRYDGQPFSLIVTGWNGDEARLDIRGDKKYFDFYFNPPMADDFGRAECLQLYNQDVVVDGLRAIPNTVLASSDTWSHPLPHCVAFHAAIEKLKSDQNDSTPASRGAYQTTANKNYPANWVLASLPPCENDCAHPLICIDTGSCRCVQPNCNLVQFTDLKSSISTSSVSFSYISTTIPHPTTSVDENWSEQDFVHAISSISIISLLQPGAQAIWSKRHALWPDIKVAQIDSSLILIQDDKKCTQVLGDYGSFSSDHVLFTSFDILSRIPSTRDRRTLLAIPFYQGCYRHFLHFSNERMTGHIDLVWDSAKKGSTNLTQDDGKDVVWVLTHDFGGCIRSYWFQNCFYSSPRAPDNQPTYMQHATVIQSMGDWNTRCFLPHKDIIIPPRTLVERALVSNFTIDFDNHRTSIRPMHSRDLLACFQGTIWGTGLVVRSRLRMMNSAIFPTQLHRVFFGNNSDDYLATLNRTQFCPLPAGGTGWSYRMSDAIYAGCIPVITSNRTLSAFFDLLDYSQFVVYVPETDIFRLEAILLSYSLEQKQSMQNKLLRIRSMFIFRHPEPDLEVTRLSYPAEVDPRDVGPLEMALTNIALRHLTEFPSAKM